MDATIDQLLQISSENQNSAAPTNVSLTSTFELQSSCLTAPSLSLSLHQPPSYTATVHSSSEPPNPSKNLNLNSAPKEKVNKSALNQLIDFDTIDAQACGGGSKPKSRFNPPLVGALPNDFLRISSPQERNSISQQQQHSAAAAAAAANQNLIRQSSTSSGDHQFSHDLLKKKMEENERQRSSNIDDKEIAQYLEDERIAIMLQNREFVSELKRNKEFMSALNYDAMSHNTTRVKSLHNDSNAAAASGGGDSQGFTDADFRERIKRMGEASKKKFAQLAGLFSRRKGSGLASRDNLLGDQYATLENDCSDGEEYGSKKPSAHSGRH